jgi:hypothetical protein
MDEKKFLHRTREELELRREVKMDSSKGRHICMYRGVLSLSINLGPVKWARAAPQCTSTRAAPWAHGRPPGRTAQSASCHTVDRRPPTRPPAAQPPTRPHSPVCFVPHRGPVAAHQAARSPVRPTVHQSARHAVGPWPPTRPHNLVRFVPRRGPMAAHQAAQPSPLRATPWAGGRLQKN